MGFAPDAERHRAMDNPASDRAAMTRYEIKRLRKEANTIEAEHLRSLGWSRAMPFEQSLDLWETRLTDGRTTILERAAALMVSKKFPEMLKGQS